MQDSTSIKANVKEKYTRLAEQQPENSSCCGSSDSAVINNIMNDSYESVAGYEPEADLGLGCGLPTQFAHIKPGDTVVDLGSGAGNDCFVARHETGPEGKVIGVDFSTAMINRARTNAEKRGFNNVEFREGDIEELPLNDATADVIVSNCVLNLVPEKENVYQEVFRVLKPGGHFSISDIVLLGELPESLRKDAEMYAGCVAGAVQKHEYLQHITNTGFKNITVQKEKAINLPEEVLAKHLEKDQISQFNNGSFGIYSITVYGQK